MVWGQRSLPPPPPPVFFIAVLLFLFITKEEKSTFHFILFCDTRKKGLQLGKPGRKKCSPATHGHTHTHFAYNTWGGLMFAVGRKLASFCPPVFAEARPTRWKILYNRNSITYFTPLADSLCIYADLLPVGPLLPFHHDFLLRFRDILRTTPTCRKCFGPWNILPIWRHSDVLLLQWLHAGRLPQKCLFRKWNLDDATSLQR